MKSRLLVLGLAALVLPAQQTAPSVAASRWIEPTREEPAGTKYRTFYSETIHAQASFLLYLPPRYEESLKQRYPVLYWLAGGQQDQRTAAGAVTILDRAIRDGKLPGMIVVAPHGPSGSIWTDSRDGKEPVETVVVKDLVPHIDATYRTIPTREARWIEGFSVGGRGAVHLGFEYPDIFGAVSILAGAVTPTTDFFSKYSNGRIYRQVFDDDPNYYQQHDPSALARKNASILRSRTLVRIMVGDQDTGPPANQVPGHTLLQWNRDLHELLQKLEIPHGYFVVPGARHAYQPLYNSLGDKALEFFRQASARVDQSSAKQ